MDFYTMDIELADRILPSYCSITILQWHDNNITGVFHTLLNPECDVESFFENRHGLTNDDLKNSPMLREKWVRIYDILEGKTVFIHNANSVMNGLLKRTSADYLNIPDFTFIDTTSISRRCFPGLDNYKLPAVAEALSITDRHNNSLEDAKTVGTILLYAIQNENATDYYDLFRKIGYVGGKFKNGQKELFRPIKDKTRNCYIAQTYDYKCLKKVKSLTEETIHNNK